MHADLPSDPVPTTGIRADAAQPFLAGIGVGGDHEVDRTVVPTGDICSGRTRLESQHVLAGTRIQVGRAQRVLALRVEHPIDRVAGSGESRFHVSTEPAKPLLVAEAAHRSETGDVIAERPEEARALLE